MTKTLLEEETITVSKDGYSLILFNDSVNTFDWVTACLIEYCEHSSQQAVQCTLIAHEKGKCQVKIGELEEMERMHADLTACNLTVSIDVI